METIPSPETSHQINWPIKLWAITIVGLLLLAIIIFLSVGWYQTANLLVLKEKEIAVMKQQLSVLEGQTKNNQPLIDNSSGWKTFRNEEYGFEFKYPEDAYFKEDKKDNELFVTLRLKALSGRDVYFTFAADNAAPKRSITIEEIKARNPMRLSRYITIRDNQWLEQMDGGCSGGCSVSILYYHNKLLRNNAGIIVTMQLASEEVSRDLYQQLDEELRMVEQVLSTFKFIE